MEGRKGKHFRTRLRMNCMWKVSWEAEKSDQPLLTAKATWRNSDWNGQPVAR